MADNTDLTDNFGILDTMDMSRGNMELMADLMSPETSTSNPDELKNITSEIKEDVAPAPVAPKGKDITQKNDDDSEEKKNQNSLSDFLGDNDDDEDEDEEEVKTITKKPEETVESDEEESGSTQFSALANDLLKLGVFTKGEDDDDSPISTPEEFLERFNAEKKKGAIEVVDNFIGQFGEDYQNAFEAIFVKGANPKEYFGAYNNVVNLSELDLSEESNQVSIMKMALTEQGFDKEDVETEIERLKNYGDLETVAAKHQKVLVKKEAGKLQEIEAKAEKELQNKTAIKNQYVNNVRSIINDKLKTREFDGIPINPKIAGELQDFLLVDKYKTATGETLTDFDRAILEMKRPENHETKVKVALLLKILEKDPTLSTIQKTGITKKSNDLFGEVARQVTKDKTTKSNTNVKPNSWYL